MIFDQLKNANLYYSLGERVQKGFEYLRDTDFQNVEPGEYAIDGEDVYAVVLHYDTKPLTAGKWEGHKKYIDIQYIFEGKEKMGYSFSNKMIVTEEYKEKKDILFYKGEGNFLICESGYFALFMPSDIHMPSIALNLSTPVKKVVVKVRTDYQPETIPKEENKTDNGDSEIPSE